MNGYKDWLPARDAARPNKYMIEAIREYLDDLEDLHLAEQRLKDIREGKSQTVPLEKVMKEHGLADWACQGRRARIEKNRSTSGNEKEMDS